MRPRILCVNPPIYDFAAYDYWLRPYGLLKIAAAIDPFANLKFFDYMDSADSNNTIGQWGRKKFPRKIIPKPPQLKDIPRHYRRFGNDREKFQKLLTSEKPFDFVLIETMMTYWYPGVREVIEDIRRFSPNSKIILGGIYATLCTAHAQTLSADMVIPGNDLTHLWNLLGFEGDTTQPPLWQTYSTPGSGAIKITEGCPMNCSYCAVHEFAKGFTVKPLEKTIAELNKMLQCKITNIAFYDDALLFEPENALIPFTNHIIENKLPLNLHTPNALHGRYITKKLAKQMLKANFKNFHLGFEATAESWQKQTGSKVFSHELARAIDALRSAGAKPRQIIAYQIMGHPLSNPEQIEQSIKFAHSLGIRIMLADFSPIPRTADGKHCEKYTDMTEPLNHSKTAFPIRLWGFDRTNQLKDLCRKMNRRLQ